MMYVGSLATKTMGDILMVYTGLALSQLVFNYPAGLPLKLVSLGLSLLVDKANGFKPGGLLFGLWRFIKCTIQD